MSNIGQDVSMIVSGVGGLAPPPPPPGGPPPPPPGASAAAPVQPPAADNLAASKAESVANAADA